MGLIENVLSFVFGPQRNAIRETVEVFRVNAEADSARDAALQQTVLQQFGTEFIQPQTSLFDAVIDGINRLPRPMLALGTIGLFVTAMVDPIWFAERMQGISLVPEPMWWIMGAIISFYFGARHQMKGQQFQRSIAESMARVPVMANNVALLRSFDEDAPPQEVQTGPNPALEDWRAGK